MNATDDFIEIYKQQGIYKTPKGMFYALICGISKEYRILADVRKAISHCIKHYELRPYNEFITLTNKMLNK